MNLRRAVKRFARTGALKDLERVVLLSDEAVAATPPGHPDRAFYLSQLGRGLGTRWEMTGDIDDLDRAALAFDRAASASPGDHPDRLSNLFYLAHVLELRYAVTGVMRDLDRTIEIADEIVASTPMGDRDRATYLSVLVRGLRSRFERTGSVHDIDRAVEVGDQAVAATAAHHADRAERLADLGRALARRFERIGIVEDLDRAIRVFDDAAATSPAEEADSAFYLSELGGVWQLRFELMGALEDLDRAVELGDRAVATVPAGHPDRPTLLSNAGSGLERRFERTGSMDDMDEALLLFDQAIATSPDDDPERAMYQSNLAGALVRKYEWTGALEDLDRAVDVAHQAVSATPGDHPARPAYLSSLSGALRSRIERTGAVDDMNRVVEISVEAVAVAPADHPDRAMWLFNLGTALAGRSEEGVGAPEDLDRASAALRAAAGSASSPAPVRAQAAAAWAELSEQRGDWAGAVDGYGMAAEMLELIAPRGLGRADQEFRLGLLPGVGSAGAAACLQAGLAGKAVELFEQGRGVLFTQVLGARSDLGDLIEAHPGIAEEFALWRDELDSPDESSRRGAAAQFERVLVRIRALAGFQRFLLRVPVADLLPAAAGGPVVLINVAEVRSDALILTPDGVGVLGLPGLDPDGVSEQARRFLAAVQDAQNPDVDLALREDAEQRLAQILEWVWDHVTGPILDHLGFSATPLAEPWPRLWWCPSGPLALLPLHAAGHHATRFDGRPATVIDRVVSSTIPTVRALLHARRSPRAAGPPRVLVVAMPHTPDEADLPGSTAEADFLSRSFPGRVDVIGSPGSRPATFATVTAALAEHAWAHFSCHGTSHLEDPSASSLLLEDHRSHPLSVLALTRQRLERVELAFLAACSTARIGTALPDEPIHLAGACQLAGYRHVIATLWPIGDEDAVRLTKAVYTVLRGSDADAAAPALHSASRRLRHLYPNWPGHWAAYTHAGP